MRRISIPVLLVLSIAVCAQTTKPDTKAAKPATAAAKKPASTTTAAQPGQKVEDMMDSFQMMERGFWEAWKNKDAKPFQQHMAPNSLIVDLNGVSDKATAVNGIDGCEVKGYELSDFKLTKIDASNALLTYKATNIDATCGSQKQPSTVYASTVFSKSGGKWWMLFHQESVAAGSDTAK